MKVTITTPYATLEADLTAHQAKDILYTAMGYAANNADEAKLAPVNESVLGEEVLDHA